MSTRPCIKRGHTDPAATQGECRTCWLTLNDPRYAAWHPDAPQLPPPAPKPPAPVQLPCIHEGAILVPCHSCRGEARHVRDCAIHGQVTREECGKDVDMTCARCRRDGLGYAAREAAIR